MHTPAPYDAHAIRTFGLFMMTAGIVSLATGKTRGRGFADKREDPAHYRVSMIDYLVIGAICLLLLLLIWSVGDTVSRADRAAPRLLRMGRPSWRAGGPVCFRYHAGLPPRTWRTGQPARRKPDDEKEKDMTGLSPWHLLITVIVVSGYFVPVWRIVRKAGYPGVLSLLLLVPIVNVVMLWMFAFSTWPLEKPVR